MLGPSSWRTSPSSRSCPCSLLYRRVQCPRNRDCHVRLIQALPGPLFLEHAICILGNSRACHSCYGSLYFSGVQPPDVHPLHDRMVRHGYRPSCRPLLASAPRFLRREKGAVGSMDGHYKRLHLTYPNDRLFRLINGGAGTLCLYPRQA
jgi:hypothetical protein